MIMNIITDSHYIIGKSHLTCDDYAINGENYIMIADGCSGSKRSELGARLNALAFESLIKFPPENFEYEEFGCAMARRINAYRVMLGLDSGVVDATAVGAYIDSENRIHVFMYGDGVYFYKYKTSDEVYFNSISFKEETPYYLSYWWDGERKKLYEEFASKYNGSVLISEHSTLLSGEKLIIEEDYTNKIFDELDLLSLQFIGVASDGLSSFIHTESNGSTEKITCREIMKQIIEFNPINRTFVKRRLKRVRDILEKDNTHHSDDISLAVMYFKD